MASSDMRRSFLDVDFLSVVAYGGWMMDTEMVGSLEEEGAALLTAEVIKVSEGPRTRQRTLVFPCDMYAEPSDE